MAENNGTNLPADNDNEEDTVSSDISAVKPLDHTVHEAEGSSLQCYDAVCTCQCTCECYEEVHPLAVHLVPICFCCHEQPDYPCLCDEEEEDELCSLHCCGCGVQLSASGEEDEDEPCQHPNDSIRNSQNRLEGNFPNADHNQMETAYNIVDNSQGPVAGPSASNNDFNEHRSGPPLPPPPPPVPAVNPEGSLARMAVQNTTPTPLTLLRTLSCNDGGPHDTRLHEAARAGDHQLLKELLEDQNLYKNLNSKVKPFMATPLREAVAGGSLDCVRLLLSKGSMVDSVDIKGQTALHFAASMGYPAIMQELLKHGANPEGSGYNSSTPLIICVRDGCLEGIKVLLKYNVDTQPTKILTTCVPAWPLQHCVVYRHFLCFLALLKGGAEPNLKKIFQEKKDFVSPEFSGNLDPSLLKRLSITRTVLRHAGDHPEFLLVYREFGGSLEGLEQLPADMQSEKTPALEALKECLECPLSLKSHCRLQLLKSLGPSTLSQLAVTARLPSSLASYLNYADIFMSYF